QGRRSFRFVVAATLGFWEPRPLLPPAPLPALQTFSHADQRMNLGDHDLLSAREQLFHERVRECIICTLLFSSLYILCYFILTYFKRHTDFTTGNWEGGQIKVISPLPEWADFSAKNSQQRPDLLAAKNHLSGWCLVDEDAAVNRIALWLCTFTLAVSLGAVLLLPFSIIGNEVLLSFPQNYYIQWLNGSLIHGLWNLVFLFSNLSLVFLMPFAYFFTESEGFAGSKKGIMARVYETFVVLLLLTLLVLGMVWVASAILDQDGASRESLYDLWEYYLPYLYSCISLFGVLLLLLCTPFGLSRMFTVTGTLLVKPRLLEDLDEQLSCTGFEEAAISRKINSGKTSCWLNFDVEMLRQQYLAIHAHRITLETCQDLGLRIYDGPAGKPSPLIAILNLLMLYLELEQEMDTFQMLGYNLETRRKASAWQRNLGYPLAMVSLLSLTGISVLVVCFHVLELLLDDAAMPRGIQDAPLGKVSFSVFGSFGAAMQVILIFYLMISSVVGFYSSPFFIKLLPEQHNTAMTKIIGNCVSLLVLSSALPVLSRTLGITRFDLLGDFGRFNWLGNFYIVFLYNMLFAGLTTLCLVKKFTWTVQAELIRAVGKPPQAASACDPVLPTEQAQLKQELCLD
ncbi:Protein LMBR1L, partial [Ophiophagus hannah]